MAKSLPSSSTQKTSAPAGADRGPTNYLESLMTWGVANNATDIHVTRTVKTQATQQHIIKARVGGLIYPVSKDESGTPLTCTNAEFDQMLGALGLNPMTSGTKVYRISDDEESLQGQVRVNYITHHSGQKLMLRLQPLTPPPFSSLFGISPVQNFIEQAQGLVVICGGIGSGKTTLAASICQLWAEGNKHVVSAEDPVEYLIASPTKGGEVTQLPCSITLENHKHEPGIFSFEEAMAHALRMDMDALFIGESRTVESLRCALELASAQEPVITTLHAGGISDTLVRMVTMAGAVMDPQIAKLTLAQSLDAILHVSLAYNEEGGPVPVVTCLPFRTKDQKIRKIVAELDPVRLAGQLREVMEQGSEGDGFINPQLAQARALERGARPETVQVPAN